MVVPPCGAQVYSTSSPFSPEIRNMLYACAPFDDGYKKEERTFRVTTAEGTMAEKDSV